MSMEEKIDASHPYTYIYHAGYTEENDNIYDDYDKNGLIDVVKQLKKQIKLFEAEKEKLESRVDAYAKWLDDGENELWKEQQHHGETWLELQEMKQKVEELEKKIYILTHKLPDLFWKYILSRSDILTFVFENISG